MMWRFLVDGEYHEAEWRDGAMRCTEPRVIEVVDDLIAAGGEVPCGSVLTMVEVGLQTAASAHATIHEAVMTVADFGSVESPQADFVPIDDVMFDDALGKASFGGDRSAAGRYAAQVRWGNRGSEPAEYADKGLTDEQIAVNDQQAVMVIEAVALNDNKMTPIENEAVYEYSSGRYDSINYALRGTEYHHFVRDYPERQAHTDALDGLMAKAPPLTEDLVLVRGIKLPTSVLGVDPADPRLTALIQMGNLKVGQSFVDKGFVSGSSLKKPSSDFDGAIRLEIVVPKGSKALPLHLMGVEFGPQEREWLLPRGKKFRVVGVRHNEFMPYRKEDMGVISRLPQAAPVTLRVVMEDA